MLAGVHQIINLTGNPSQVYTDWVKMSRVKISSFAIIVERNIIKNRVKLEQYL